MVSMTNGNTLDSIRYTKTRVVTLDPEAMREHRIVMGLYNDPRANVFRVLRTNILTQLRENGWNSFAITSATPDAGKSFVSVNLAMAIAMEGNQSVILVDADLRRPSIGDYLGLPVGAGLIDYLKNMVTLEEVLFNPGIERLVVLPGRDCQISSSEWVSSPKMQKLLQEVKSRYETRIVILDMPPLCVADDAMLLLPYIDGTLLVLEDEKNTKEELEYSMHVLEQTNLLGTVLNKSRKPLPGHHYGYYGYEQQATDD